MRAFNYGKTIHAQPLTEQGRKNWDVAFGKKDEQKATGDDDRGDIRDDSKTG